MYFYILLFDFLQLKVDLYIIFVIKFCKKTEVFSFDQYSIELDVSLDYNAVIID